MFPGNKDKTYIYTQSTSGNRLILLVFIDIAILCMSGKLFHYRSRHIDNVQIALWERNGYAGTVQCIIHRFVNFAYCIYFCFNRDTQYDSQIHAVVTKFLTTTLAPLFLSKQFNFSTACNITLRACSTSVP